MVQGGGSLVMASGGGIRLASNAERESNRGRRKLAWRGRSLAANRRPRLLQGWLVAAVVVAAVRLLLAAIIAKERERNESEEA